MSAPAEPLVELRNIHKSFGAVQALQGASLSVGRGEVVGLVGDNGAGKSTFMKVLTGVHRPTEGAIRLEGREVHFSTPSDSRGLGIEMIYQNLALAPNLDVVANVFLGREIRKKGLFGLDLVLDEEAMEQRTIALLHELKIHIKSVRLLVERMSGGQQQAVAIARAVAFKAKLVIMDEPTAALAVKEVGKVLDIIRDLKQNGVSVIIISHRLQDIFQVADKITVMQSGRTVAELRAADTNMDEVVRFIVGGSRDDLSAIASGR